MGLLKRIRENKSIIKFAIVGVANTLVDFFVFIIFVNVFCLNDLVAQTISYGCGVLNSFFMNKFWAFKEHKTTENFINQFGKFILTNGISLTVSLIVLNLLNSIIGINVYISKVMVTLFLQIFNYIVYKFIVFKYDKSEYGTVK